MSLRLNKATDTLQKNFLYRSDGVKVWTLPNILTVFRIVVIPFFVLAYYLPFSWSNELTAILFLLAAITDWFDGYLARKMGQMSSFGAFLDPVADKLMVAAALVLLVAKYNEAWLVIPGVVIIGREILISALREWMAELGKRATVKVSYVGKVKTTVQMIAIIVLLSQPAIYTTLTIIGIVLMYLATILTLWSMTIYLLAAKRVIWTAQ